MRALWLPLESQYGVVTPKSVHFDTMKVVIQPTCEAALDLRFESTLWIRFWFRIGYFVFGSGFDSVDSNLRSGLYVGLDV